VNKPSTTARATELKLKLILGTSQRMDNIIQGAWEY
jgi:hypothetical protein